MCRTSKKERQMSQVAPLKTQERTMPATAASIRDQMNATTRALVAAEEGHRQQGVTSVEWERRGLLRRLTRRSPG
jgi:hypothetical protein